MTTPLHAKPVGRDVVRDPALVPSARVNLLPPEIEVSRQVRSVKHRLIMVLAGLVAVALLAYGWSWYDESRAASALEAEQATLQALRAEQQQYALLPSIQTTTTRIDDSLAWLMTNDVAWDRYLEAMTTTAPAGVAMTNIEITMQDITERASSRTSDAVRPGDLDTSGQEQVGVLIVTGTAPSRESVAAWSDALAEVDGFLVPYLLGSRVVTGTSQVEFSIEITLSSAVRSLAYAKAPTAPSGAESTNGDAG